MAAEDFAGLRESLGLIVIREELAGYLVDIVRPRANTKAFCRGGAARDAIADHGFARQRCGVRPRLRHTRRHQSHGVAGAGTPLILRPRI